MHQQEMRIEGAARLLEIHIEKTSVMRLAGCHHHVVDPARQATEESLELKQDRWRRRPLCSSASELAGCDLEALGVPAGEDQLGPLPARARRAVSSPIPALPPITTTICPMSSGSRWTATTVVAVLMIPPGTRD